MVGHSSDFKNIISDPKSDGHINRLFKHRCLTTCKSAEANAPSAPASPPPMCRLSITLVTGRVVFVEEAGEIPPHTVYSSPALDAGAMMT